MKLILCGCNGRMGRVITALVAENENMQTVAGVDITGEQLSDFPVFAAMDDCDIEADVIIVDDMISSGGSMIDVAKELKSRGAGRIFVISTFGLFTNGMEKFDKAYEEGLIYRIVTTNLTYQPQEYRDRPYFISCDLSKYIAYLIDTLNHDASISELLDPYNKIKEFLAEYNEKHTK